MKNLIVCLLIFGIFFGCSQKEKELAGNMEKNWWSGSEEVLLDSVSKATFRYFYDFAHPVSGMARERSHSSFHGERSRGYDVDETVTSGGTGFGVMAFIVAVERGWVSRQDAVSHLMKLTNWLIRDAVKFHGMFSHWYEGTSGKAFAFSQKDNGGDIVESAYLFQGLLAARQYFNLENTEETNLRANITQLWEAAEWDFYRNNNPWILWHWSPDFGFEKNMPVMGFDETQIVYILAACSPTHPVNPSIYDTGWAIPFNNRFANYGDYVNRLKIPQRDDAGGPLFFTHYSYLGMPPYFKDRYVTEAGYADYFEHNKDMALANKAWCEKNGYPENCWGLTSSDDPWGYSGHSPGENRDNGTITPSASIASIPYIPEASIAAMHYFLENHADSLWGDFGFKDAFNLKENYFAPSYLAIDQGPIPVMIENYRTGLVWKNFVKDPDIQKGVGLLGLEWTKKFE